MSDTEPWKPNVDTVQKTIKFALATKRLKARPEEAVKATQQA